MKKIRKIRILDLCCTK